MYKTNIMKWLKVVLIGSIPLVLCAFTLPKGWQPSGSAADKYEIGLWKAGGYDTTKNCGVIRSNKKVYDRGEYGSMIQKLSSQRYLGKRIRLSGYMKTRGVTAWAGFFLRADVADDNKPVTFDNMHDMHVTGNTNWKEYNIELDVPVNASKIVFGARLHGEGMILFDNVKLETIGEATLTSDYVKCDTSLKREPENLDFEL